jgi:hypothetical protein
MYGSIYRMQPKDGMADQVTDYHRRWERDRKPMVRGAIAAYVFRPTSRPTELVGVVVFDSEANYERNAADPEQNRWYNQLRGLLVADPEWNDGDILVAI